MLKTMSDETRTPSEVAVFLRNYASDSSGLAQ